MRHVAHMFPSIVTCVAVLLGSAQAMALQTERAYTPVTRYNLRGQVTGTISPDPDGAGPLRYLASRNSYDARGLLVRTESGELSAWLDESVQPKDWAGTATFAVHLTTEVAYDDFGRKVLERVRGENGTLESLIQYSYAANSLVQCKAVRMNPALFASPPANACAPGAEGPFGPDRITRYGYDALDQVVTEERAVGVPGLQQMYVFNTYNHRLLATQIDANGNRTELRYDAYGRLLRRVYPSPTERGTVNELDYAEFTYDAAGNLRVERKRDGRTITTDFDANHRPIRKDLSDNRYSPDVYYDYDLRGLELYSRFGGDGGPGQTLSYDGFGNLLARTSTVSGATRTIYNAYDSNGNRTRIVYPDGISFSYTFDGLDRVNGLLSTGAAGDPPGSSRVLGVEYARDGKRATILRPGAITTQTRDPAQRLARFAQTFASAEDGFENTFSYNPASQITRLVQSNDRYNFREVANRTGVYLANGLNQYTAIGGQGIEHDANGNLTSDGERRFTYDLENRLVAASGRDVDAALKWDTNGRLHELVLNGVATQFLYDGDALVAEYSGGVMTRRYVHGDQVDEPWLQFNGTSIAAAGRRYLVADHQGSVIAHSDNDGRVLDRLAYDSYGIPAVGNADRFGFTGQAWIKQLGLYHYKARMYHPRLGRFLQTDPIGYRDDFNLYSYAAGDPVNLDDSSGTSALTKVAKAVKAILKGEDLAETFADNIQDLRVLANPTSTGLEKLIAGVSLASELLPVSVSDAKDARRMASYLSGSKIDTPYKRPSRAVIPDQRAAVQGKPCVKCGTETPRQVAGHKKALVEEYYETGTIDKDRMRSVDAVQPECPTCSAREGAEMSRYSRKKKEELGL